MKKPPARGTTLLGRVDQWRSDAYAADLDFAELMRHFNGGALISDTTGAGRDRVKRANLLFGHKYLGRAIRQVRAPYFQGEGMIEAELLIANDPVRRHFVEQTLNRELNAVVRESERLKWPYKAICGDAVLWGAGFAYRDDPYDWCPKYGRPLFPWDAPADITDDKFSDWAFPGRLTVRGIMARLDRLEKIDEKDAYWSKEELRGVVQTIIERNNGDAVTPDWQHFWDDDPVSIQQNIESQTWGDSVMSSSLPVYWYFSKNFDTDYVSERPIDLYCLSRLGEQTSPVNGHGAFALKINREKPAGMESVLFYQDKVFDDIRECFFPFVMDCMEGGEPLMRRVLGLGAINYDLDVRMQNTISAGLEGAEFDFAPLFQSDGDVSQEILESLQATGIRPYDFFPQEIGFVEKPRGTRPYQALMSFADIMNSEMGQNAASEYGQSTIGGDKGRKELEVQALERQNQDSQATSERMDEWKDRGDCLCNAIGKTLLDPLVLECDVAHAEQRALLDRLAIFGIAPEEVMGRVRCKMRRPPGSGNLGLALQRVRMLLSVSERYGAKAQQVILKEFTRIVMGGDARLADVLVPENQDNPDQVAEAQQQNAVAIAGRVPPVVRDSDQPAAHVPVHVQGLQTLAMTGQKAGGKWRMADRQGFEALTHHAMADVQRLSAWDPEAAKRAAQHIHKLAGVIGRFELTDEAPAMDPAKQAELQLKAAEFQRKAKKDETDLQRWIRTQEHREQASDEQTFLRLGDQKLTAEGLDIQRMAIAMNDGKDDE